jgi:hypothetical protein
VTLANPSPFMKLTLCLFALLTITAAGQVSLFRNEGTFTTIDSIAAVIPLEINLRPNGKWSVVAVERANEALASKALKHPATLRLKVEVLEPFKDGGWGYRIMAPDSGVPINGIRIPYRIWAYFRPDEADRLLTIHKGSLVTLSGHLGRADIQMGNGRPGLNLDLYEAKVER